MNFKNHFNPIVFLFLLLVVSSCKKEIYKEFEIKEGVLIGNIIDSDQNPLEGVNINLQGTEHQAVTDINGNFRIESVKTDIYSVEYTKDGYGAVKDYGYQYVAGEVPTYYWTRRMTKTPNYEIKEISYDSTKYGSIELFGKIDSEDFKNLDTSYIFSTENNYAFEIISRYFVSNKEDVSSTDYLISGLIEHHVYENDLDSSFSLGYFFENVLADFQDIKPLYLTINTVSRDNAYYYYDINTGCKVYTNISKSSSNVIKIKIPNSDL